MCVGQKMSILNICLTIVTCLNLRDPEVAPEETTYATQEADQGLKV